MLSKGQKTRLNSDNLNLIKENFKLNEKFKVGDVLVLDLDKNKNEFNLSQIPKVNGGLIVLETYRKNPCHGWWL